MRIRVLGTVAVLLLLSVAVVRAQGPYPPTPDDCHDVTPPGGTTPACCMYGYVYCGTTPLAGAILTVTNGLTTTAPLATRDQGDGRPPYYSVDLSHQLAVTVGTVLTVTGSYSGHSRTVVHQVLVGSQQVDVVLPTDGPVIVDSRDIEPIPIPGDPCDTAWDVRDDWGGLDGHCLVTLNAHTYASSTNSGVWRPDLPACAYYQVEVWAPDHDPYQFPCTSITPAWDTSNAHYEVFHRQGDDDKYVDMKYRRDEWVDLDTYEFDIGTNGYVRLTDLTGEPWATRYVVFDDVRFTPLPSPPVATITAIQPRRVERGSELVYFHGMGSDTDEGGANVVAYEWVSSLDGVLSTQQSFTVIASALTTGTHTITLRVQDDEGTWSATAWRTLQVRPSAEADWLFMFYLCGDNNLETWLGQGLQKAVLAVGDNPCVRVVALFDGAADGDTHLYKVYADGAQEITGLSWLNSELNLGDPQTLIHFVDWARAEHPTKYTYLSLSDHGGGVRGTAWDETNAAHLTLADLGQAFATIAAGDDKLDVVHYDACLMSMIEVAYPLRNHADYLVASENLGWCIFAYDRYIAAVGDDTPPRTLAGQVALEYFNALPGYPRTVAALDLARVSQVVSATNTLAGLLHAAVVSEPATTKPVIAAVRDAVQKLDSQDYLVLDDDDAFVDLYDLARLFKTQSSDPAIQNAAQGVMDAIGVSGGDFLVWEEHASGSYGGAFLDLGRAYGLSIYFPPHAGVYGYSDYMDSGLSFVADTRWDEFLREYVDAPPGPPGPDPGIPPMLQAYRVYLPVVVKDL